MSILDIRDEEEKIEAIKFDDSGDLLRFDGAGFIEYDTGSRRIRIVDLESFDDFINAMYKAKNIWLNR